uniref:CBM1 domain-containing protein n=1 Tax=Compsopogon caeruleus TaxID=31354 RepID=A0A7S1TJR4_9RHOD
MKTTKILFWTIIGTIACSLTMAKPVSSLGESSARQVIGGDWCDPPFPTNCIPTSRFWCIWQKTGGCRFGFGCNGQPYCVFVPPPPPPPPATQPPPPVYQQPPVTLYPQYGAVY